VVTPLADRRGEAVEQPLPEWIAGDGIIGRRCHR
jgi:hypothetical protein